jgi:hypothetical protein
MVAAQKFGKRLKKRITADKADFVSELKNSWEKRK